MTKEGTHNIHKTINSILPFFKSKRLCKEGIHNYMISTRTKTTPEIMIHYDRFRNIIEKAVYYHKEYISFWKCACCGKEEKMEDEYERY